jgi:hypothetical protein
VGFQQGSRSRAAALAVTAAAVAVDVVHVPDSRAMLAVAALYNGEVGLHSVVLAYGHLPR